MRLNWMIHDHMLNLGTVQEACAEFIKKNSMVPDTVKLSLVDFNQLLTNVHFPIQVLERGKQYGQFLAIPGGMVELVLLTDEETTASSTQSLHGHMHMSMIVVECSQLDREFEKHVLNKDPNG